MARANIALSIGQQLSGRADATSNHEGGLAFHLDPRSRLMTRAATSLMGENQFYHRDERAKRESEALAFPSEERGYRAERRYHTGEQADADLFADVHAVAAIDPEFVLRLAAYCRQVLNLRTASVAILVEAAAIPACKPYVRQWTPQIVRRADELAEAVARWIARHGQIGSAGPIGVDGAFPHSLRKGLMDALRTFDEYQLAKYDRKGAVTIRDVLRIVRPTPLSPAESALWKHFVSGDVNAEHLPILAAKARLLRKERFDADARALAVQAHATWEVLTSKFGRSAAVWNAIDLPFMAGLRNLANLMRNGADEALDRVLAQLRDPNRVRRSKQFPYRFFSAWKIIESGMRTDRRHGVTTWVHDPAIANHPRRTEVLEAINQALEHSVVNLPRLPGATFITADNSGSMCDPLSEKTIVQRKDVANLLAAVARHMSDRAITSVFGESHAVVPVVLSDSILTNMRHLAATDVGYSTNAYLAIRYLRETGTRVDRIILFSDMQCYDSTQASHHLWHESVADSSLAEELRKYRSSVNPEVFVYSVDLAGYGTSQFPQDERGVALLAGWSERFLEFIPLFEEDATQAIERIAQWEPDHTRGPSAEAA